jgi:hypothetical protein
MGDPREALLNKGCALLHSNAPEATQALKDLLAVSGAGRLVCWGWGVGGRLGALGSRVEWCPVGGREDRRRRRQRGGRSIRQDAAELTVSNDLYQPPSGWTTRYMKHFTSLSPHKYIVSTPLTFQQQRTQHAIASGFGTGAFDPPTPTAAAAATAAAAGAAGLSRQSSSASLSSSSAASAPAKKRIKKRKAAAGEEGESDVDAFSSKGTEGGAPPRPKKRLQRQPPPQG